MYFFNDLDKYASNTAIITEKSEKINYGDLLSFADTIGKQIENRCLIFAVCNNSFEAIAGYIGLMRAGAVLFLIHDSIHHTLFRNLLDTFKPKYVYLPSKKSDLIINSSAIYSYTCYTLFKTNFSLDYSIHKDLALLLSTSGSTGDPKLVRLSYKNIYSNAKSIAKYLSITSDDRPVTTMPMAYSYALSIVNSHLLKGASIIVNDITFMERRFWQLIKKKNATTFGGVPFIFEMLKKLRFANMDLPSLRYITQAGGKLDPELFVEFVDIFSEKQIKFYVMYGQTEASPRMSYLPWEFARTKTGSIGIPITGGHFWLADENGEEIKKNDKLGELIYEGDNVALGYAYSYKELCHGDENKGVLHTGDIATSDLDGFYYIIGRKRRFLNIYGNRVNLDSIVQIIKDLGYDCACKGTDDNLNIYLTNIADRQVISNYLSDKIKINKKALTFLCIDKIPRNDSGKVLYSSLGNDIIEECRV